MASLNEAFVFPLTSKESADKEVTNLNVPGRGSYIPLDKKTTNTYKTKDTSALKMYNEKSLK